MLAALALSSSLVFAACTSVATLALAAPTSPLVRWRPCAWTPPVAPECGAPASDLATGPAPSLSVDGEVTSLSVARAADRAAIRIRTRPDGSRYALVGGAFRLYMIATFDADGGVQESCVGSRAEALQRVAEANTRAAAKATARKEK